MNVRANINNGIIFEVKNIKISLYFLELNKYFIPLYVFRARIEDICRG